MTALATVVLIGLAIVLVVFFAVFLGVEWIASRWAIKNNIPISGSQRLTLASWLFFDGRSGNLVIWRMLGSARSVPYSIITRYESQAQSVKEHTQPLYLYTTNRSEPVITIRVGKGRVRQVGAALEAHIP